MADTLVSILLPTYEPHPDHLRAAIESVRAQTESRWTLFIRDDASAADVYGMVAPFLGDTRITFERGNERRGIGGNWNACLEKATGPCVQYIFQDDRWDPHYLARAIAALESTPRAGFAVSDHAYLFEGSMPERPLYDALADKRRHVTAGEHIGGAFLLDWLDTGLHPNIIGEPSFVLLRKTLVEEIGPFAEDLPQLLDIDYWTRCLAASNMAWIAESGGEFRVHPDGASARNQREGRGMFDRLQVLDRTLPLLPRGDRPRARRAIVDALAGMIRKYRARAEAQGTAPAAGGGGKDAVKRFALRHPLLTLRAVLRSR